MATKKTRKKARKHHRVKPATRRKLSRIAKKAARRKDGTFK